MLFYQERGGTLSGIEHNAGVALAIAALSGQIRTLRGMP